MTKMGLIKQTMIKIIDATPRGGYLVELSFSTKERAVIDFSCLLEKRTPLTKDLEELGYFREFFLELGCIGWKNGLEPSGESLYQRLANADKLILAQEVA